MFQIIQNSRTSLISILLLYKYSSYDYGVIFFMSKCVYIFWATLYITKCSSCCSFISRCSRVSNVVSLCHAADSFLDWTWWNDSLATMIAGFNTPLFFCVRVLYRQCFYSTSSFKFGRITGADNRSGCDHSVDMIHRIWDEIAYRWDICRVTRGNSVEHL